jgi:hypothetical protein
MTTQAETAILAGCFWDMYKKNGDSFFSRMTLSPISFAWRHRQVVSEISVSMTLIGT